MKQTLFSDKKKLEILNELEAGEKKFVELKKVLGLDSNILSYHLKMLMREGIVVKKDLKYFLSEKAKHLMPYLRNLENPPLPCVAVIVMEGGKVLVRKKEKEPGKGKGIFVGGRIEFGEDVFQSAKRHVKSKVGVEVKNLQVLCVNNYVSKNKEITSHYIVFFVKASPVGTPVNAVWKFPDKIRGSMFPDNKFVIKNMLNNRKAGFFSSFYDEDKKKFRVVSVS